MRLKFEQPYKSIERRFDDIELPDFVVLTGKNGSGKTHLLTGIKEGSFIVDEFAQRDILQLSYLNFAQNFQTLSTRGENGSAWERFNVVNEAPFRGQTLIPFKEAIESAAARMDKPIVDLARADLEANTEDEIDQIFHAIASYKANIAEIISVSPDDILFNAIIRFVINKTKVIPSDIGEKQFNALFRNPTFGGSPILSDLSNVFFTYFKNIARNEYDKFHGEPFLEQEEFLKTFGEAPWDLVRNIFSGFGLNFDVNDPVQDKTDPIDGSFRVVFKNNDRGGKTIDFNDLSSGEQILITLVNAIYTSSQGGALPKLLLLDEIDSPLNPSIIDKFISYIADNFVANGMRVIMATHSPSTVAFAQRNSVFLVNTREEVPLKPMGINNAIQALSEGLVTLADIVELQTITESKVVISEGKNFNYLKRAKDVYEIGNNDIKILDFNIGGTAQLRTLLEFMHVFNTSKTFIFVFDCDYKYQEVKEASGALVKNDRGEQVYKDRELKPIINKSNPNNRVFIFPEYEDSKSKRGIENLFGTSATSLFQGEFDEKAPKNKKSFEKYILNRNVDEDFINFKPLFDFINTDHHTNF